MVCIGTGTAYIHAVSRKVPFLPANNFYVTRARVGILTRNRQPDDPELLAARLSMREEALIVGIERALRNAPPITDALRTRIEDLLDAHPVGVAA